MIKPIAKKNHYLKTHLEEEPLVGYLKYSNNELESLGVKEGDLVSFQPNSEYEYNVEGEKLYRMFTNNITLIHE